MTLMPGMTEGHCHPSFTGVAQTWALGMVPPEEHTLKTAANAKLLLDCGFTSIYCAASAKPRLDVVVRNAINAGELPGPRMRAGSPEIVATGGLGDERMLHLHRESFALIADGPEEIRRTVRMCIREGVDNVKLNISGDDFFPNSPGGVTTYMDDEVKMACDIAHEFGKQVASHSRSANSVKLSVRNGVDCIYHCEHADEEALDMMEAAKDRIFVGPAVGLLHNTVHEAAPWGITEEVVEQLNMRRNLQITCDVYKEVQEARHPGGHRRRLRLRLDAPGHQRPRPAALRQHVRLHADGGADAGDQERRRADAHGKSGQLREGMLADMLLVDGDPLQDLSHPGRPAPARHDHEGRPDPQGSGEPCRRTAQDRRRIAAGALDINV